MKRLADICDIQYGYAFDSKCFTEDSSYPQLVRIRDVKRGYSETYYSGNYPDEYILSEGDLLIGMDGEFNIARWKCSGALLNQRVCKLTTKVGTNEEYLRFAMLKSLKEIEQRTAFVTVKHLSAKELNKLELDVPELTKQDKIADTLSRLERVIEARKEELEELDELIKARFVEMFGDPVTNSLSWEEHRLEEYIEFLTSGSRGWSKYFVNEKNELFITIKNVKNNHIVLDNIQYIDVPQNKEAERTKVKTGDLLISITADLGRTAVVDKEVAEKGAYINQHLSLVRLDAERINPLFVSHFLETDGGKLQFKSKNQSAVKAGLNFEAIKSLKVLAPPIELQNQFADFVRAVDKSKIKVQKALDETQKLFDSLMQQYFG